MEELKGMGVALSTPFEENGDVDVVALRKLVQYQLQNGTDYLVVLGTTGEYSTLTAEERELVKDTIIDENNGQLPVVLGIGGNNTKEVGLRLQTENTAGFDAILSVSPYYNKPSQEGIYQHFKALAEDAPLPILVYNVPGRTSSNILPGTLARLGRDCEKIIGVKEAAGSIQQAMKIVDQVPDDFMVISGEDMVALPMVLAGGSGVISVVGQAFPKGFSEMIRLGLNRRVDEAFALHYKYAPAIDLAFEEGNPAGIKAILHNLGIGRLKTRLPLVEATPALRQKVNGFVGSIEN